MGIYWPDSLVEGIGEMVHYEMVNKTDCSLTLYVEANSEYVQKQIKKQNCHATEKNVGRYFCSFGMENF